MYTLILQISTDNLSIHRRIQKFETFHPWTFSIRHQIRSEWTCHLLDRILECIQRCMMRLLLEEEVGCISLIEAILASNFPPRTGDDWLTHELTAHNPFWDLERPTIFEWIRLICQTRSHSSEVCVLLCKQTVIDSAFSLRSGWHRGQDWMFSNF